MSWTHANLETQGYRLGGDEARALRIGLRFPTALCLALVVTGLALESALMIALLVPIGAVAGWTPRHPFDLIWNRGLRHPAGAPELPQTRFADATRSSSRLSGSPRLRSCSRSTPRRQPWRSAASSWPSAP